MAESPLKRSVKFVASDHDGLPVKRRQTQQACQSCRKKKKRCPHASDVTGTPFLVDDASVQTPRQPSEGNSLDSPAPRKPKSGRFPPSPESLQQPGDELDEGPYSTEQAAAQSIELSRSRFVGDMIPESIFIEAASKSVVGSSLYRAPSGVGAWLPRSARKPDDEHGKPFEARWTTQPGPMGTGSADDGPASLHTLSGHLAKPYNERDGTAVTSLARHLAVCPSEDDYKQLQSIYLECIHPMLPVISEADVHESRMPRSLRHSIFRQVIAFAAAVEPSASKHLRLDPTGPLLSFQVFHQLLSKAIFASLDANALSERVDHIRVLLIMSFFYQPGRANERDLPSLIFSQAVHYAQSLGIHLIGYSGPERDTRSKDAEGLFCALWALDRTNASFNGLPCLLHERDTDRDLEKCIAAQEQPAFRLFLKVAMMLDRVICLYRPSNKGEETVELPIYESMIMDAGAERLPTRLHATLEVFYHYVAVLSCRQPPSAFAPSAPPQAHLPHPSINARRSLSADRIVETVSSSLSSPSSSDSVVNLPFVPYAVALSLSVSYRKMRYSKVAMYRMRGKTRFEEIVAMLKILGEVYTCARVNAGLGEAILREMDKTAKELASSSATGAAAANGPASSQHDVISSNHARVSAEMASGGRKTAITREGDGQQDAAGAAHNSSPSQPVEGALHMPSASGMPHVDSTQDFPPPPVYDEVVAGRQQQQVNDMGSLPSSSFGDVLDVDLFGHFDPDFDLNAVDVALEANLDMGFPQTWTAQWPE